MCALGSFVISLGLQLLRSPIFSAVNGRMKTFRRWGKLDIQVVWGHTEGKGEGKVPSAVVVV